MPHAAFLTRDIPARMGQGAFLVLRVVDLLTPERRDTLDARVFNYQWKVTDVYLQELADDPEGDPQDEVMHLRDILDAAQELHREVDAHTLHTMAAALSAYAINRSDCERADEAIDLLDTAWRVERGTPGEMPAAMQLGAALLDARMLEEAARWYRRIERSELRDAKLIGSMGRADILLARGENSRAERAYRRLRDAARLAQYDAIVLHAEVGVIKARLQQDRAREALLGAWALRPRNQAAADPLLARALEALGALDAAARLYAPAALGGPPAQQWESLAALVRCARKRGDRLAFARWRKVGEAHHENGLPPAGAEAEFWAELERGVEVDVPAPDFPRDPEILAIVRAIEALPEPSVFASMGSEAAL
jgi:tetratricopeptide (TPR) repeat protein